MSIDVTPTGLGELALQVERELVDNPDRHSQRWTLVSGGLANVWRYGDLPLDAPSGRLLLRGANGTGKTTALEALCPYLLDLNAAKLAAGKARPTTLNLLMSEGADGKRRTGYAWLTFAAPHEPAAPPEQSAERSWGVRLQYAPNGSPKVRVIPFTVPGRPLRDLALFGPERAALTTEQFEAALAEAGGETFEDPDAYVDHLAATVWRGTRAELATLTAKLRDVRNPSLLAEVSAESAATALRSALPTVAPEVVADTAKALAASDETRDAFDRDRRAAEDLTAFATTWTGHVADVVGKAHAEAAERQRELIGARRALAEKTKAAEKADEEADEASGQVDRLSEALATVEARLRELTGSEEYQAADRLHQLRQQLAGERQLAAARIAQLVEAAHGSAETGRQLRSALADLSADLAEIAGRLTGHDDQPAPDLAWRDRPRSVHTVGDAVADPGPGLEIIGSTADLTAVADRWSGTGRGLVARAESAELASTDHQQNVAAAEQLAGCLRSEATQAATRRDELRDTAHRAADRAGEQQHELLAQLATWATTHPALCRPQDTDELPSLTAAEPGQVLTVVEDWYVAAQQTVTEQASTHKAAAARHEERADQLDEQAEICRAEAADWRRDGKLLPLPRPGWAGATDGPLLGDVLTWADVVMDAETRNRLEVALADAGILGASLTGASASGVADTGGHAPAAPTWQVRADGPVQPVNLTAVLAVDPEHPDAAVAVAVLERIALAEAAHPSGSQDDPAALVVGYDGSFAAGTLVGHRLAAGQPAPAAVFVGARQRREAALATAARLDADAAALDAQATAERTAQGERERQAAALTAAVGRFPSRQSLTRAEDRRVLAQQQAGEARERAERADEQAGRAEEQARTAHREWAARCRDRDLPADLPALTELATRSRRLAAQFTDAARAVRGRPVAKLTDLIGRAVADTAAAARLPQLHADAHTAHEDAAGTAAMVQAREELDGASIAEVLAKVEGAERDRARLRREGPTARERHEAAISERARTEAELGHAQQAAERAEPSATLAPGRLARLLRTPEASGARR